MGNWDSPDADVGGLDDLDCFGDELRSLVETAVRNGASATAVEEHLQREAQRMRESLWSHRAFVFECADPDCDSSHVHLIDRETVTCDRCHDPLLLVDARDLPHDRLLEFACEADSHTTRSYTLDLSKIRCSIHDERMTLTESYPTEEGSNGTGRV